MTTPSIVFFTDFGPTGPYSGQMEAVIRQIAPNTPVIQLLSNAPKANPRASAYLLAAFRSSFPDNTIFLSVIDPGVGSSRLAIVLWADGHYFVGPDNDLFATVAAHAEATQCWQIVWQPDKCSTSFHGRDIFAPIAAKLALGQADCCLEKINFKIPSAWPHDLTEIIYFDFYGNAMTGLRYHSKLNHRPITIKGHRIKQAKTFHSVAPGELFWYCNSSGLIEIAANLDSAERLLNLEIGETVHFID